MTPKKMTKPLCLLCAFAVAGCASVDVRSDRSAKVYVMGALGLDLEGPISPGETMSISRFLHGSRFEVGCLADDGHFAFKEVAAGAIATFEKAESGLPCLHANCGHTPINEEPS